MKIRTGFVSNSSATSFYFSLNGGKEELLALIMKYRVFFDFDGLKDDDSVFERGMSAEDLVSAIKKLGRIQSVDIGACVKESEKRLQTYADRSKEMRDEESRNENPSRLSDLYDGALRDEMDLLSEFDTSKKRGLRNLIRIDMGDHEGAISGGLVGNVMDYRGRYINIDKKDFRIFTRQNR